MMDYARNFTGIYLNKVIAQSISAVDTRSLEFFLRVFSFLRVLSMDNPISTASDHSRCGPLILRVFSPSCRFANA
jgi:hypothetical protein